MNRQAKTLVVLTPGFPKDESETSWLTSQQLLVLNLKKQFPEINILVFSFLYPFRNCEYRWHNIRVVAFGGMKMRKLQRLWLWRNIWKSLRKAKQENDLIGILSFWCHECAFIGKWFSYRNGLQHLSWICGQDARKSNKYAKWIRPRSDDLIAISDFVAEEFARNHKVKPQHLVPNAIDVSLFQKVESSSRDIDILGAGSLIPLKQYDVFTDIVAVLKLHLPHIKVIHCGEGREKEKIRNLIGTYDLHNNFLLRGGIDHHELLQLMQRSKVFLHPSGYEGFSTVCLEALYTGAHVVSFVKPMHSELQNWHIVKTKEEMIAKTLELLQASNLNHESVPVFSMEDSARKMMLLFNRNQPEL